MIKVYLKLLKVYHRDMATHKDRYVDTVYKIAQAYSREEQTKKVDHVIVTYFSQGIASDTNHSLFDLMVQNCLDQAKGTFCRVTMESHLSRIGKCESVCFSEESEFSLK